MIVDSCHFLLALRIALAMIPQLMFLTMPYLINPRRMYRRVMVVVLCVCVCVSVCLLPS